MSTDEKTYPGPHATDPSNYILHIEHGDSSQIKEEALVRKIDLFLLPTIWLMYLLSYVDRTKFVILAATI